MSTPVISIILPIYNTEPYLRDALDSILHQTLQDLEVICVDDGSPDNSIEIIEKYAAADSRVRILRQDNQGLSMARNNGAKLATGTWIYFMDSDDVLKPEALEKAVSLGTEEYLDMVCFHAEVFADDPQWEDHARAVFNHTYRVRRDYPSSCSGMEYLKLLHEDDMFTNNVWLFILRRDFCQRAGLSFYPGVLMEDVAFHVQALLDADRVGCVNEVLYRYRIRNDSILTMKKDFRHAYGMFIAARELWKLTETRDLPEEIYQILADHSETMLHLTYLHYVDLPPEELKKLQEIPMPIRIQMESICHTGCAFVRENKELGESLRSLGTEHEALCREHIRMQTTLSYRLGRAITAVPRKIKSILKK